MMLSSIWSDSDYFNANTPSLLAMRDSIRLGTPMVARNAPGVLLKRGAQVGGVALLVLIVVIQVVVLYRERKERLAERARLLS